MEPLGEESLSIWVFSLCAPKELEVEESAFSSSFSRASLLSLFSFRPIAFTEVGTFFHFFPPIFINHRIGSYIESNKNEFLTNLEDLQMRNLLVQMADINPVYSNTQFFTRKFVSDLKSTQHQSILFAVDGIIESSDFSKIRNTGKKFYTRSHLSSIFLLISF